MKDVGVEGVPSNGTGLTRQQSLAAGTKSSPLFIEAGPGTGKTAVSAHRFGVYRYQMGSRSDARAVVAVSFTRAATANLVQRVRRLWGTRAITWPHRVVTLDTIMSDLVHDLLRAGLLKWPNGHTELAVVDSWSCFGGSTWNRTTYWFRISQGWVETHSGFVESRRSSVPATISRPLINEGICTHQDIRDVLQLALADASIAEYLRERLSATTRAIIVDEVFDANELDIDIIELAVKAGLATTLVGDPWQALYVFRGAKPEAIPLLVERQDFRTLPLTCSFRWTTLQQEKLALDMRAGRPVVLSTSDSSDLPSLDVVLALWWKRLWELGSGVLPLAFHAFKGGYEEAAATLLLNHITRNTFGLDATYLNDSLTALAITDRDIPRQIEAGMQEVLETLRATGPGSVTLAYGQMARLIETISARPLRPAHARHTARLALLQQRLAYAGRLVPGLTTHQAKGGEWDAVGIRLSDDERATLAGGLRVDRETDRKLYVACTRARKRTVEVVVS
jgi:DNA helicase-2/ATP-dependent DNA helicase PcrA